MKPVTIRQIKTLREALAENRRYTTELLKMFSCGKESDDEVLHHSNNAFMNAVSWVLVSFEPHVGTGLTMLEHLSSLMTQIDTLEEELKQSGSVDKGDLH